MAKRRRKASPAQKRAQNNMKKAAKACAGTGEEFQSCVAEQLTGTGLGQARRRRRRRW